MERCVKASNQGGFGVQAETRRSACFEGGMRGNEHEVSHSSQDAAKMTLDGPELTFTVEYFVRT